MSAVADHTIQTVAAEIGVTLGDARAALEIYSEGMADPTALNTCANRLHEVFGVLRVIEVHGAALLAEEMELAANFLSTAPLETRNQPEGLDPLMRAMVQLPAYLERVLAGGRDVPLVLLPLLNDLRAVRGQALLSEGTLLLLNLTSDRHPEPALTRPGEPSMTSAQWARKLRPRFQIALLGVLRGERLPQHLDVLAQVAERLEKTANQQSIFQLWWVVGAVIEALRHGSSDGAATLKRLLGQADREMRRLHEIGESRYAETPPIDLLNNLLYFIARTPATGDRISAVRSSFRLQDLLPVSQEVEDQRASLSAPSAKLMETVGAAIREDLARVKDALDVFVRTGGTRITDLVGQTEMLRKIGDTLGVLGLANSRIIVQAQLKALGEMITAGIPPSTDALVEIAAALISVEDSLETQLVGLIMPTGGDTAEVAENDVEFQQVQAAVLRECIVNLAHIKEAVGAAIAGHNASGSEQVPALNRGIIAGLMMLGRVRAIEIFERIGRHVVYVTTAGTEASAQRLDRLADAIVSIEYYMETLQSGRSEPLYMLDNAEACLRVLEGSSTAVVPVDVLKNVVAEPALAPASADPPTALPEESGVYRAVTSEEPVPSQAAKTLAENAIQDAVDPDLIQLFIEEAREELPKIQVSLQSWDRNPLDDEALTRLRRSFHTLKGSGRMVGARLIGDYAWSIEHLLNRIISGTRNRTPPLLGVMRDAVAGLPALIDQLETRQSPTFDVADIMARLHGFSEGHDVELQEDPFEDERAQDTTVKVGEASDEPSPWMIATSVLITETEAPTATDPLVALPIVEAPSHSALAESSTEEFSKPEQLDPAAQEKQETSSENDSTLIEIYRAEVANHIASIKVWVSSRAGRNSPHLVTESLYRACHTLAGASRMADISTATELAEPLHETIRRYYDQGVGLSDHALPLLTDYANAFAAVASTSGASLAPETRQSLYARLSALNMEFPVANTSPQDGVRASENSETDLHSASLAIDPIATGSFSTIEFDPEIAAIFSEEATELLESAGRAVEHLRQRPKDVDARTALKRYLHTLKGGARMAGVSAMGALAHEFETLLTKSELGEIERPYNLIALLESGLDAFESMRRTVQNGMPADPALELVSQLQRVTAPPLLPPKLHALADEQPEPQPMSAHDMPQTLSPPTITEVAQGSVSSIPMVDSTLSSDGEQTRIESLIDSSDNTQSTEITSTGILKHPIGRIVSVPSELEPSNAVSIGAMREDRQEVARVDAELLDNLLNGAGEISIQRARLEQQLSGVDSNLGELARVVGRLRDQLRNLEIETEAQVVHRYSDDRPAEKFDPLELDRYSTLQQYSRALAESASDVASIQGILETQLRDAQNLLTQQARVVTDLQNGLMRTRMVSFQKHTPRLTRIVRQAALETGKQADLFVTGATGELDRQVLERMLAPFEHMLRNAVVHGIETPERRLSGGKTADGRIEMSLRREGSEVVIVVQDDGAGLDLKAIREKAAQLHLVSARQTMSDADAMQLILEPGFSTAAVVTPSAGRGVGMDVVTNEVKRLGGSLRIDSTQGQGTRFTIRLPFTLAVSQALILRAGTELYALPLPTVESVVRLPKSVVLKHLNEETPSWSYAGQVYRFQHLGLFIGGRPSELPAQEIPVPVVLIRAGDSSTAVVADELVGSREIVIKNVGPLISAIRGIAGATMLGDGRIVVILDLGALVRGDWRSRIYGAPLEEDSDRRTFALVVDDSITVRRVTQRLLERNGMRVLTARDGVEALTILEDQRPDVILLDIEMPRMDGYEVAARIRADDQLRHIPIVMITSRVGEKHRARAIEIGVDDYLGKPYQETQLLDAIEPLVSRGRTLQ
jgi:chemosensory pili system protein ChpA (sensor histidine kinase/response regulator)